jgi:diguanylate cyclase (GGDEF)-like protein
MDETLEVTPEPVEFKPLPPVEGRDQALRERREYSKRLAMALLEIKRLEAAAYTDAGTGLPNRAVFEEQLPKLFEIAKADNAPLALMTIDVDGLKRTNEGVGHPVGDELLKAVGRALKAILRPEDIAGRLGGDEFYGVLGGYSPMPGQTIEKLNSDREKKLKHDFAQEVHDLGIPDDLHVGITVGISVLGPDDTLDGFVKRSDDDLRNKKVANYSSLEEQGISFHDERLNDAGSQSS